MELLTYQPLIQIIGALCGGGVAGLVVLMFAAYIAGRFGD